MVQAAGERSHPLGCCSARHSVAFSSAAGTNLGNFIRVVGCDGTDLVNRIIAKDHSFLCVKGGSQPLKLLRTSKCPQNN
jgi:hypothetical protein